MPAFKRRKSIFDLFDEMFKQMFEEFEELEKEFEEMAKRGAVRGPYVYGVRITVGPDGVPRIEEFGNVKRIGEKPVVKEEMDPLVDVFEDEDEVVIVAEIPGASKDDIHVKALENKVVIKAKGKEKRYYKEIELPVKVDPGKARASYKNGVLEVRIKKADVSDKGVEIKVE
ncbi:MAG: Hsp20/alpha crystallin family protein [Desulfurococcales archaeon]|nr:Hsp20/alpha crystallin family protein [Desulfurococcales archaeon]